MLSIQLVDDAYLRDLHLVVPSDCMAANTVQENEYALEQMQRVLKADVRISAELPFSSLL